MQRVLLTLTVLMAFACTLTACPAGCPNPTPTQQKWIDCGKDAIGSHGIPLIPKVNDCVTGAVDVTMCLIGLISPAAGITADVIACVVRDQGAKFAESADDPLETKAACQSAAFLEQEILGKREMQFKDGYTSPADGLDCSSPGP